MGWCVKDCKVQPLLDNNTFKLLLHARRGLWSPSSMQELSSFHSVDPNLVCCDEYDIWVL